MDDRYFPFLSPSSLHHHAKETGFRADFFLIVGKYPLLGKIVVLMASQDMGQDIEKGSIMMDRQCTGVDQKIGS